MGINPFSFFKSRQPQAVAPVKKTSRAAFAYNNYTDYSTIEHWITQQNKKYDAAWFYENSGIARGAIDSVCDTMASIKYFVSDKKIDGEPVKTEQVLAFLENANEDETFNEFVRSAMLDLELYGELFIEWVNQQRVYQAYALSPYKMKIDVAVSSAGDITKKFTYTVNAKAIRYENRPDEKEEIVYARYKSPRKGLRGTSPCESALPSLLEMKTISDFNRHFVGNGLKLSKIIEIRGEYSDEEIDIFKKQVEQEFSGSGNAGKAVVIEEGVITVTPIAESPKDMEFLLQYKLAREEFLAAVKVPPVLVGIFEYANYANSESQIRLFWESAILPKVSKFCAAMTRVIRLMTDNPRLYFVPDLKSIEALQQNMVERTRLELEKLKEGVIDYDEFRAFDNKAPIGGELGKMRRLPAGAGRLDDLMVEVGGETGGGEEGQSSAEQQAKILNSLSLALQRAESAGDEETANLMRDQIFAMTGKRPKRRLAINAEA